MRTNQEILQQTNELARVFYRLLGYVVPEGHRFDQGRGTAHPQERLCWQMACEAQLLLTETDVEDAIADLDEEGR